MAINIDSSTAGQVRTETAQANKELWTCWQQLRYLKREKARLKGEAARISVEREAARRRDAEVDRKSIADAANLEAHRQAITGAKSIDRPRPRSAMEEALAWAASGKDSEDMGAEFDEQIDPETYENSDTKSAPLIDCRVKRKNQDRVRTR